MSDLTHFDEKGNAFMVDVLQTIGDEKLRDALIEQIDAAYKNSISEI